MTLYAYFFSKKPNANLKDILAELKFSIQVGEAKYQIGNIHCFTMVQFILSWNEHSLLMVVNAFVNTGGNADVEVLCWSSQAYSTDNLERFCKIRIVRLSLLNVIVN